MAKYNLDKYTSADGLGFPLNFRRGNPNPLDQSELYDSYEAAVEYATNDPVAYVGQIITVLEFSESDTEHTTPIAATVYSIQDEAGTLKEVGSVPVGDGLTIEVIDGQIKLKGAADAEVGAQPRIKDDGSIEWIVPSTDTVDGLQTAVAGLQSDVSTLQTDVNAVEAVVGNAESGLVKDVADNTANISAIDTKIGTVTDGKTIVEMISDAKTEATYDDTALAGRVSTIENDYLKAADKTAIETKMATDISTAKTETIAAIMGEAGIDEKYDTLKEIADWILSDTTSSAELITRVTNIENDYLKGADKTALQGEIDALETFVGTLPEDAVSTNVVAYIKEVVDGLKIGDYAKAADLTALTTRVSTAEGKIAALEEVGAEKNIINSVDETQFAVDAERKLTLLDIAMDKVIGLSDALDGKIDKAEGSRLMTDAEGTKLAGIAEGAEVNVIESVDDAQFAIDEAKKLTLLDVAMSKVSGLADALSGKVDKVEGSRLITSDEATKLSKLVLSDEGTVEVSGKIAAGNVEGLGEWITNNRDTVAGLFDTESTNKLNDIESGAQVNDIEVVKIAGTALGIIDKSVDIPIATNETLGVVLGSTAENKVDIDADGTMEVNSLNVNKLIQTDGEVLILNGGSSSN